MDRYDYLIIGGGMTADAAAHGIRELDTSGSIGIVSSDPDAPYNRPPLSKALWKGEKEETIWRGTDTTGAQLHLDRRVTAIDAKARVVTDNRGDRYDYGSLLLATGGTPRHLPGAADGVVYFRTYRDYRALREMSTQHEKFAVLGGGFIGSEIAAALRMNARQVTMIVPEKGIGARVFPQDLAIFVTGYYREKGVDVRTDTIASSVRQASDGFKVGLPNGATFDVAAVVAGLGIVPNVDVAQAAGVAAHDGIAVNERLRTNVDGIYAAGDVARFQSKALGSALRVEHEDNANTMGRAAGRAMAGDETPYEHLPFFYSDLFELGYEAVGILDSRLETVANWKEPFREGVVYYIADGRVRGVLLWNVWGKVDEARALIAETGLHHATNLVGRIKS